MMKENDLLHAYREALRAATTFEEVASVEETLWTGSGGQDVPAYATMRRIKAEQAVAALRDADPLSAGVIERALPHDFARPETLQTIEEVSLLHAALGALRSSAGPEERSAVSRRIEARISGLAGQPCGEADVATYYSQGKTLEWFEGLSDADFVKKLRYAVMDFCDSDTGHLDEYMPIGGILELAATRIEKLVGALAMERPTVDRDLAVVRLVRKFPSIFTPFGNGKEPNALAGNVVDELLSLSIERPDREALSDQEPHDPSKYCGYDACRREGCTLPLHRCMSEHPTSALTPQPAPLVGRMQMEATEDLISHRDAWRSIMKEAADRSAGCNDFESASYIRHEIRAFDRVVGMLKAVFNANRNFRAALPAGWEGDPLNDACEALETEMLGLASDQEPSCSDPLCRDPACNYDNEPEPIPAADVMASVERLRTALKELSDAWAHDWSQTDRAGVIENVERIAHRGLGTIKGKGE